MKDALRMLSLVAVAILMAQGSAPAASGDEETAKQIIEASGVRVGLCLHIGAGRESSAGLTAALAAKERLLVHGLATDETSLARARVAIASAKLSGRAMVERIDAGPESSRLPYLPDLANLVVVEDPAALAKSGITREELLRVTAPGGVLCVLDGGKWVKAVKPRPEGMDEWTHPKHGADGNNVSTDKFAKLPIGLRWIDGLPMNVNKWASCRAWVVAGGRIFMVTANELENLGPAKDKPHYLSAHDAFNGLPLWKIKLGTTDDGALLYWLNTAPLATDGKLVYAATTTEVIGADAATGQVVVKFPTKYPPARLLVENGVLVASCWEGRDTAKSVAYAQSLWSTWTNKTGTGTVEAFDTAGGKPVGTLKWSTKAPAESLVAADGVVYLLEQTGNPPTKQDVVAIDLQSGKERWRASHSGFGEEPDLQINAAFKGGVVVVKRGDASGLGAPKPAAGTKPREKGVYVLSAADGTILWEARGVKAVWTPIVDGQLWVDTRKRDLLSGKETGPIGWSMGEQYCTPQSVVGSYLLRPRGGAYIDLSPEAKGVQTNFGAARGACIEGMAAANGMFYTAQNNCRCSPGQVYGFVAAGPVGANPTVAEFEKARPTEKGPAFGAAAAIAAVAEDWPMFRHDGERSATTTAKAPAKLKPAWKSAALAGDGGPLEGAWRARVASRLSAPVAAGGKVLVAATDEGRIIALDAATGQQAWSVQLGSRVNSPPTITGGLALVGCHDGWVYALSTKDGQLAWRTRVAPLEKRMVAHGQVESVWPVVGTVLVKDQIAYASAGRSSESDGGVALVAMDLATGKTIWARNISGAKYQNDLLAMRDGAVAWWHLRFDPTTGKPLPPAAVDGDGSQGGMNDGVWTVLGARRSGNAFRVGRVLASVLAWDKTTVIGPTFAMARTKAEQAPASRPTTPAEISAAAKQFQQDCSWTAKLPAGAQAEAIALTASAAVYAGRTKSDPPRGFATLVSTTDGQAISEVTLDALPTCDGLAVAGGKVFVSLQDGTIVCLGE